MAQSTRLLLIEGIAAERLVFQHAVDDGYLPYDYQVASTAAEARRLIEEQQFEVIVAASSIGSQPTYEIFEPDMETPVVFTVPAGDEEKALKAGHRGFFDYVVKDTAGHYLKLLHLRIEASLALREARKKAESAETKKSVFIANASHELRTPLNGILGMTELLARTELSTLQQEYLESIRTCGTSLLLILNDVLDLAKVESGKLALEQKIFDLYDSIQTSMELLSLSAEKKGVAVVLTLAPDVPTFVHGDANRLRQVLTNLIGNAIKFTEQGSVTIRVRRVKHSADLLRFEVKDTGIGISPRAQATIFEPFVQADSSTSRRFGGTGLGLAICRQLVTLLGGEIGVESTPGAGSLFWFHLPLPEGSPLPSAGPAELPREQKTGQLNPTTETICPKLHILLAEDNALNQKVTVGMLSLLGHTADIACDGSEALKLVQSRYYDLLLLDCEMPIINGFEASRAIRKWQNEQPKSKDIPIIALTAHLEHEVRAECLAHGMNGCLSKPFTLNELKSTVEKFANPLAPPDELAKTPSFADPSVGNGALPVLDLVKLDDLRSLDADGESHVIHFLFTIFFQEGPPLFRELLTAIDAGNCGEVVIHAHKLTGSCANFGGMETARFCRKAEQYGRSGDIGALRNLKPFLEIAFDALCIALKQELDSSATTP